MTLTTKEAKIQAIIEERVNNGEDLNDVIQEYVDDKEIGDDWANPDYRYEDTSGRTKP